MRDERLEKLARVLVDYSLGARERDRFVLSGGVSAEPLIKEVYSRLLRAVAAPVSQI